MNIKKLSALVVLVTAFVLAVAIPALALDDFQSHMPACVTFMTEKTFVVACEDSGGDIIMADITKYTQKPKYTVMMNGAKAVITVYLNEMNRGTSFSWVVADKQGNQVMGFFPVLKKN